MMILKEFPPFPEGFLGEWLGGWRGRKQAEVLAIQLYELLSLGNLLHLKEGRLSRVDAIPFALRFDWFDEMIFLQACSIGTSRGIALNKC